MQIKRFEAKDMTTALRLIKGELGPEAVILSARNIKKANTILGLTKSVGVEVTAAVDAYHLPRALNSVSYAGALKGYRRNTPINGSKKQTLRQSAGSRVKTLAHRKQALDFEKSVRFKNESACADVFQHLLTQGVNRDIATEITAALNEQYEHQPSRLETKAEIISKITEILKQKIIGAKVPPDAQTDSQVIAVIGPTGVGKTTTVAKLAAKHAIELKNKVALISLDSYRIGAAEQLKVYARAIAIPLKTATTLAGFKTALHEFRKFDLILVDTPGFNPEKQTEIDELRAYLTCDAAIGTHLVLSAGTKEGDLHNTFRRIKPLAVQNLIFTKLDESRAYGNLINFLMECPLPLSFLTHGREVPEAIESGSLEKIVACIFGGFIHAAEFSSSEKSGSSSFEKSTRLEGTYFVANKNSDVFHLPDCKWTQKIGSKNRVTFLNAQAAQEEHFMPCRDCQPLKRDEANIEIPMDDHVRFSNYL